MPVYKLEEEMPYTEFLKWVSFFEERPSGWREDQRTYMLLAAAGVKEKPESLFPSLNHMQKAQQEKLDKAPDRVSPKGHILQLMSRAVGGDEGVTVATLSSGEQDE
jgi:hypothetical protein